MLPILDISKFLQDPLSEDAGCFVRTLVETCHQPGFFYLVGHGIPLKSDDEILKAAQQFFSLPQQDRHDIAIGQSPHFRGYTVLGDEITAGKNDWREQLDIGPDESAVKLTESDPAWLRLKGPNQWPKGYPEMETVVSLWMKKMESLSMSLIQALALGLEQEMEYFDNVMQPDPYTRVKIVRYPELSSDELDGQGLGLHHDSGLFTFIFQNDVPGLQVQLDDQLLEVEPMAGAYVVNLGEMFQTATNGFLRATKHRVQSPRQGKPRISIAYFMNPRLDSIFESITLPPNLASRTRGGQNTDKNDPIHRTFGDNTLKVRMRAHPDVADKFYTDMGERSSRLDENQLE